MQEEGEDRLIYNSNFLYFFLCDFFFFSFFISFIYSLTLDFTSVAQYFLFVVVVILIFLFF